MAMAPSWWVLVVDDDAEVNALIVEMLCDAGIVARGLTQGRAAIALLEGNSPPSFVIADMTMPDVNGLDLVGRAQEHGINGLVITAADTRRLPPRATAPVPVMRKPFEVDELISLVERHRADACDAEPAQIACSA